MRYIITRHAGAIEWLRNNGIEGEIRSSLSGEPDYLRPGDEVVGGLPPLLLHRVMQHRAVPFVVQFPVGTPRGREMTAEEMDKFGAKLIRFAMVRKCQCKTAAVFGTIAVPCKSCGDTRTVELEAKEASMLNGKLS